MQDPDLKCRHFVISWHFMAFWHVCQKANCITKSAFSAFSRLFHRIRPLDFSALVNTYHDQISSSPTAQSLALPGCQCSERVQVARVLSSFGGGGCFWCRGRPGDQQRQFKGFFFWQFLVNICFSSPKGNYISSSTLKRFLHPGEQPTHCNFHLPTFRTTPWQRPRFNGRILYSYKNREFLFVSSQNFTWNHSFRLLSCPTCVETPWRRFLNKQTIQGKKE